MEFMVRDNILHKNGRCNMEIVLGLLDAGVRQADEDDLRFAGFAGVDFDGDGLCGDAVQGSRGDDREHGETG